MNRRRRQIQFQRLPVRAIVEGNVDAIFRARKKQSFPLGIFLNRVHVAVFRQSRRDSAPALSIIRGLERIRPLIIEFVPVDGHVRCARRVRRRINEAH